MGEYPKYMPPCSYYTVTYIYIYNIYHMYIDLYIYMYITYYSIWWRSCREQPAGGYSFCGMLREFSKFGL